MAFNDPQSITIDGATSSLPRFLTGTTVGQFTSSDASIVLSVEPAATKQRRSSKASVRKAISVTDPVTGLTRNETHSITIISNRPLTGVSDADAEKLAAGFISWLTASTNANLKKLLAGEN